MFRGGFGIVVREMAELVILAKAAVQVAGRKEDGT
jgi:hypothetical protein